MLHKTPWHEFVREEINTIKSLLAPLGITLADEQPHTKGESFLTTKDKLVLIGSREGERVIVKASRHPNGHDEIARERQILEVLHHVPFARDTLLLPQEIIFRSDGEYLIWVSQFIEQETVFASRPIDEQFFLILRALESQEAFHATTFEHLRTVKNVFNVWYAQDYFASFKKFRDNCHVMIGDANLDELLGQADIFLRSHKRLIDSYCNYLNHTDFAPSNFRIHGRSIYLIDLSSIAFGNKYEGLARLLNHALLHTPELHDLLLEYIRKNRGEDEYLDLRLMRIYKAAFLLDYYARALARTSGDLERLMRRRIAFWSLVLRGLLDDVPVPTDAVDAYKADRDALRSDDELERQKQFNRL